MKNIGILGGSFDPIHSGHIELATYALIEKNLDFVFFMPTKRNPFKKNKEMVSDEHRVNMIKCVVSDNMNFCLLKKELQDEECSYTYNTLKEIKEEYVDCNIFFIVGTDSMLTMDTWYKGIDLLSEFFFIVSKRPGYKENELYNAVEKYRECYNSDIYVLEQNMPDVSSTRIKKLIKDGESIDNLVPEKVKQYIYENKLYI